MMNEIMNRFRRASHLNEQQEELTRQEELYFQVEDILSQIRALLLSDDEELDEEKKKKKNCVPGNVWHRPAGTEGAGQFTNKGDAGSFSLQWSKSGSDCRGGVARMPGQKIQYKPCGRKNRSGGKAKHRCSVKGG